MRFHELLTEAAYHKLANALKRALPDKSQEIDAELAWAEQSLKRPDRINWYMLVIKNYFNNTIDRVKGTYRFTSLDQLHNDLVHFYGFNAPSIEAYVYEKQTIGELISALDQLLKKYEEAERNKPKPVTPQTGDHVLFNFVGGFQWWWVDRGYCSDEGRSGRHCGNVVGQRKTDQRLLSLRKDGHVLLTFVLEPNGALGEMKARGNQKPSEKYHPQIIRLLMWRQVTAIQGMGYLPDANFSMFDLSEKNLAYMDANKPKLIADQCRVTPIEILKAPKSIQKKYQQYVDNSAIQRLIADSSVTGWGSAVKNSPKLIIYAPHDMPGFENQLLKYCSNAKKDILLKVPNSIARNPELLNKIVAVNGILIAGVNPSVRGYPELCKTAVQSKGRALRYVPEDLRDREICRTAVANNGNALQYVPEDLRDREMYQTAVQSKGRALRYVPVKLRDREMCLAAVKSNGSALDYVPVDLRDREMYRTAVANNGYVLDYVPEDLRDREMCLAAVKSKGYVLQYVPVKLRDREMCLAAVKSYGYALAYVPEDLRDREMYRTAVANNGYVLDYVPEDLRDREMCMAAVNEYGKALQSVPEKLRDRDMCLTAVANSGTALHYVPEKLRDLEMYQTSVANNGKALQFVPEKLRDRDMCLTAVANSGTALHYVPEKLRDLEMYQTSVANNGSALHYVPKKLRDRDMCLTAVANNGNALHYVPEDLRDLEMCLAVLQDPEVETDIIDAVPYEIQDQFLEHAGWDNDDNDDND